MHILDCLYGINPEINIPKDKLLELKEKLNKTVEDNKKKGDIQ